MLERTIQPVNRVLYDNIRAEIKRRIGLGFDADNGILEMKGFRVQYDYREDLQTLDVKLLSKPWFVPESIIASKVDEYLAGPAKSLVNPV